MKGFFKTLAAVGMLKKMESFEYLVPNAPAVTANTPYSAQRGSKATLNWYKNQGKQT